MSIADTQREMSLGVGRLRIKADWSGFTSLKPYFLRASRDTPRRRKLVRFRNNWSSPSLNFRYAPRRSGLININCPHQGLCFGALLCRYCVLLQCLIWRAVALIALYHHSRDEDLEHFYPWSREVKMEYADDRNFGVCCNLIVGSRHLRRKPIITVDG